MSKHGLFAVLLLVVFSVGASQTSTAQATASPGALSQRELGEKAISYIVHQFAIDQTNPVPETHKPLTKAGNWSIANGVPAICANLPFPCAQLSYRQPGTNVLCQWTLLLKPDKDEGFVLDLNEDAARYFSRRHYDKAVSRVGFDEITGGKLISFDRPLYPEPAKQNLLQGVVKLLARIDENGHISDLAVISGPGLLHGASIDAVKRWVYEPLRINSVPLSVRTVINVDYSFR
jgi:TonB family protein